MLFDDAFVEKISESPVLSVMDLCDRLLASLRDDNREWTDVEVANITETFALLRAVEESGIIIFDRNVPPISGERGTDSFAMMDYIRAVGSSVAAEAKTLNVERLKSRFANGLRSGFTYEFSSGDLDRIQTLISELRNHIAASTLFEENHKQRLLRRLEKLQGELHKRMSDIDKFWGLIGDAGVALGKFGNDAKPIIDRVREITGIVWNAQSRAEELPSNTQFPSLPPPAENLEN